ncbi:hypothetical protein EV715DRAFT_297471 [Schizophyllum commune]
MAELVSKFGWVSLGRYSRPAGYKRRRVCAFDSAFLPSSPPFHPSRPPLILYCHRSISALQLALLPHPSGSTTTNAACRAVVDVHQCRASSTFQTASWYATGFALPSSPIPQTASLTYACPILDTRGASPRISTDPVIPTLRPPSPYFTLHIHPDAGGGEDRTETNARRDTTTTLLAAPVPQGDANIPVADPRDYCVIEASSALHS